MDSLRNSQSFYWAAGSAKIPVLAIGNVGQQKALTIELIDKQSFYLACDALPGDYKIKERGTLHPFFSTMRTDSAIKIISLATGRVMAKKVNRGFQFNIKRQFNLLQ